MDVSQLRELINTTTAKIGYQSDDATELLLMTIAHESTLGRYIHQITGPACGIAQMEPITYMDIWQIYLKPRKKLANNILTVLGYEAIPPSSRMTTDLMLAIIMARMQYLRRPEALPSKNDVVAMSQFAKCFYNTKIGSATAEDYAGAYNRLVAGK